MVAFKCKIRNEIVDISECSLCHPKREEKVKEGKIKNEEGFLGLSRAACKMLNKIEVPLEEIPHAVTVDKTIPGDLYRTVSNSLVRVHREDNTEGPQIYLVSERDDSRVKISADYILFSDIEKLLVQKEKEEVMADTATGEKKETKKSREEIRREKQILREEKRKRDLQRKAECDQVRLVRKDKGTKTSHIDNLLKEGREIEEITKIVSEKFPAEGEAMIKRLIWSRRAVYRKSVRDGQHEQSSTTKDSTDSTTVS